MMGPSTTRISAVAHKELAEFRRNRLIVITMSVFPILFIAAPTFQILTAKVGNATSANPVLTNRIGLSMLYLMMVPVVVPATVSAYSIVGERDQGTLEPLLTTPVTRAELILGKAAAIFIPAIGISYTMLGIYLAVVELFAKPVVATTVLHAPQLWSGLAFAPLLCTWSIWAGLTISSKVSDTRVAQQLTLLGSLPPLVVVVLFEFQIINATPTIALLLGGALLVIDAIACFFVTQMFDRERLITGSASRAKAPATPVVIKVTAS